MGGVGQNLIRFELEWHPGPVQTIKNREGIPYGQEENPRLARTVDDEANCLAVPAGDPTPHAGTSAAKDEICKSRRR